VDLIEHDVMKNLGKLVLCIFTFIATAVVSHVPSAILCLYIVNNKTQMRIGFLMGIGMAVFTVLCAVQAIRNRRFVLCAIWGVLFSFAVALVVVVNTIMFGPL
jgi:hypothetical protein